MSENNPILNSNDSFDINELASLNEDISVDFLEQLQNQITQSTGDFNVTSPNNDGALFEEVTPSETDEGQENSQSISNEAQEETSETEPQPLPEPKPEIKKTKLNFDDSIDDNFIKKYKAKLNKQNLGTDSDNLKNTTKDIEDLSDGKIIEKPIVQEQLNYNDSLDYLDQNIKYSKYVIYIDPENTDFIDSLTVKERKNLINKILKEQDDIAMTKKRFNIIQTVIKHLIIAIITITLAIPAIYYTINASLEATINNYKNSKSIFQTLYKEKGKIQTIKKFH